MLDQQQEATQSEKLSSDIQAFCGLVAKIMIRCLKEKNLQAMELLSLSSQLENAETGGTHDAA